MTLSELQENITSLFLRLNGYISTGLIIHSDKAGENKTQIDILAIRFPHHKQEDRIIGCCDYLQIPENTIDFIIGEVKGGGEKNQFNLSLREDKYAIEKLVQWVGIIESNKTDEIVNWLVEELKPKEVNKLSNFPFLIIEKTYSLRPIIFNIDSPMPRNNQKRFVCCEIMINYIWECFRPKKVRDSCSTNYPYNMWGSNLTPIVEYIKDKNKDNPGTLQELYKYFGFK